MLARFDDMEPVVLRSLALQRLLCILPDDVSLNGLDVSFGHGGIDEWVLCNIGGISCGSKYQRAQKKQLHHFPIP